MRQSLAPGSHKLILEGIVIADLAGSEYLVPSDASGYFSTHGKGNHSGVDDVVDVNIETTQPLSGGGN